MPIWAAFTSSFNGVCKYAWRRGFMLVSSSVAELYQLLRWDVYTRAPFLYAGSKAACLLLQSTQRLQSSRPPPTGGPSQALVCVLYKLTAREKIDDVLAHIHRSLWGNKKGHQLSFHRAF